MTACFSWAVGHARGAVEVRPAVRRVAERARPSGPAAGACGRPRTGWSRRPARVVSPATGYVAKLGLRCSPSVTTGEPVASKRSQRVAHGVVVQGLELPRTRSVPAAAACMPSMSSWGRGMLPMGSVGMLMRGMLNDRAGRRRVRTAYWAGRPRTTREGHMARDDERLEPLPAGSPRRRAARAAGDPHRAQPDARAGRPPARPRGRAARQRLPGRHDQPRRARDAGDGRLRRATTASTAWTRTAPSRPRCSRRAARTTSCRSSTSSSRVAPTGLDAKMQALLHIARTVRRDALRPHRGRRPGGPRRGRHGRRRPARGPDRGRHSRCTTASSRGSAPTRRPPPRPTRRAPARSPSTATAAGRSPPSPGRVGGAPRHAPDVTTESSSPSERRDFIREIVAADVAAGRVTVPVTRFPPEPNGYLHIGHAKSIALNFGIASEFGGRCNLRFDDTNPEKEEQAYIDAIEADVRWLGFDWGDNLFHASDYFEQLYAWAVHLDRARASRYVDDQSADETRETRGTLTAAGHELALPGPARRGEPRPVRAHARGRVRERRARAAGEDRHGVAQHQPARPGAVPDRARERIRGPATPGASTPPTTWRTASRTRSRA